MNKLFDINEEGFSVRCRLYYNTDIHAIRDVVIATHGFGGFKDNKSIEKFAERLDTKYKSYAVVCFDWPCHGADARKKLVLDECLKYLELVISYTKDVLGAESIYNYSTSFGAYLTLLYISKHGNPFRRIALRAPAIRMHHILDTQAISEEDHVKLARGKEILIGRDRKLKIGPEFMEQLKEADISKMDFMDYADDILIMHGTKDSSAPFDDSMQFADDNVIEFITVEKADHRFSDPKMMDQAIVTIIDFFAR